MKKFSFVMIFSFLLFLSACGGETIETNLAEGKPVPDFEFVNQDEEIVSLSDLKGKWWVADFIFTNCADICIPMTTNMVNVQKEIKEQNLDVELISFTVDPDYDSPEVLKEYAEDYGADLSNWSFLTGYEFNTIKELALDPFMQNVENISDSDQVAHASYFYLINPEGEIIKYYSGLDLEKMDELVEDLGKVS